MSNRRRATLAIKRASDLIGAALGLLVAAPVLTALALRIRLEDGGPVLFLQDRVGRDGIPFRILKLRTMCVGAENQGLGLNAARVDPRTTRCGIWLRRTALDELPQLWNVLRGDMSLVGPRPTLAVQVVRYGAFERRRLEVRPGLTGLAQVRGRNSLSWQERIAFDVAYVERLSLWLDFTILLRTPLALLAGGTYGPQGVNDDYSGPPAAGHAKPAPRDPEWSETRP